MQDQAFLGPGVGARRARRGRRRRPLRRDPVAARRPAPDLRGLGLPTGPGPADPGRRRWRVRRPRGPVDARARLPARAAHRQAGEDGLQPRGVLLRPRAPAPGEHALRARRRPRRQARLRPGRHLPRRRRLRVDHAGRRRQRGHDGHRPVRRAERPRRLLRRLHEQPAVRRDARLRLRADRVRGTRRRWTSSPPRSAWTRVELRIANAMEEGSPCAARAR